jgi:hypothetical protein
MRRLPTLICGVLFIALGSITPSSLAQLVQPNSHAYGKSFEEWNVLFAQRAIEEGLGEGSEIDETVGRVRLLPGSLYTGPFEFDVTLPPGTPFVAPAVWLFGETYDNGTEDDPFDPFIVDVFENFEVLLVFDGEVLMDDTVAELERFQFGPVYFDEPLVYSEPLPRGPGVNATSAIWTEGLGSVFHPLPPGEHTLVQVFDSEFFGHVEYRYNITVSNKKKQK